MVTIIGKIELSYIIQTYITKKQNAEKFSGILITKINQQ